MVEKKELYMEYVWIAIIIAILASFAIVMVYISEAKGYDTPSSAVTCNVRSLREGEVLQPGVKEVAPGVYEVTLIARQWQWMPNKIVLENPNKIIFKISSEDVIHGFEIAGTPVNFMIFPGYIAEIEWIPPKTLEGTFTFLCNEYCGLGHDSMYGELVIVRG